MTTTNTTKEKMPYVFGSSTPRDFSYLDQIPAKYRIYNVRMKSQNYQTSKAGEDATDHMTLKDFLREIRRAGSPQRAAGRRDRSADAANSRMFVFGSSTPRELSYLERVPHEFRLIDAVSPGKFLAHGGGGGGFSHEKRSKTTHNFTNLSSQRIPKANTALTTDNKACGEKSGGVGNAAAATASKARAAKVQYLNRRSSSISSTSNENTLSTPPKVTFGNTPNGADHPERKSHQNGVATARTSRPRSARTRSVPAAVSRVNAPQLNTENERMSRDISKKTKEITTKLSTQKTQKKKTPVKAPAAQNNVDKTKITKIKVEKKAIEVKSPTFLPQSSPEPLSKTDDDEMMFSSPEPPKLIGHVTESDHSMINPLEFDMADKEMIQNVNILQYESEVHSKQHTPEERELRLQDQVFPDEFMISNHSKFPQVEDFHPIAKAEAPEHVVLEESARILDNTSVSDSKASGHFQTPISEKVIELNQQPPVELHPDVLEKVNDIPMSGRVESPTIVISEEQETRIQDHNIVEYPIHQSQLHGPEMKFGEPVPDEDAKMHIIQTIELHAESNLDDLKSSPVPQLLQDEAYMPVGLLMRDGDDMNFEPSSIEQKNVTYESLIRGSAVNDAVYSVALAEAHHGENSILQDKEFEPVPVFGNIAQVNLKSEEPQEELYHPIAQPTADKTHDYEPPPVHVHEQILHHDLEEQPEYLPRPAPIIDQKKPPETTSIPDKVDEFVRHVFQDQLPATKFNSDMHPEPDVDEAMVRRPVFEPVEPKLLKRETELMPTDQGPEGLSSFDQIPSAPERVDVQEAEDFRCLAGDLIHAPRIPHVEDAVPDHFEEHQQIHLIQNPNYDLRSVGTALKTFEVLDHKNMHFEERQAQSIEPENIDRNEKTENNQYFDNQESMEHELRKAKDTLDHIAMNPEKMLTGEYQDEIVKPETLSHFEKPEDSRHFEEQRTIEHESHVHPVLELRKAEDSLSEVVANSEENRHHQLDTYQNENFQQRNFDQFEKANGNPFEDQDTVEHESHLHPIVGSLTAGGASCVSVMDVKKKHEDNLYVEPDDRFAKADGSRSFEDQISMEHETIVHPVGKLWKIEDALDEIVMHPERKLEEFQIEEYKKFPIREFYEQTEESVSDAASSDEDYPDLVRTRSEEPDYEQGRVDNHDEELIRNQHKLESHELNVDEKLHQHNAFDEQEQPILEELHDSAIRKPLKGDFDSREELSLELKKQFDAEKLHELVPGSLEREIELVLEGPVISQLEPSISAPDTATIHHHFDDLPSIRPHARTPVHSPNDAVQSHTDENFLPQMLSKNFAFLNDEEYKSNEVPQESNMQHAGADAQPSDHWPQQQYVVEEPATPNNTEKIVVDSQFFEHMAQNVVEDSIEEANKYVPDSQSQVVRTEFTVDEFEQEKQVYSHAYDDEDSDQSGLEMEGRETIEDLSNRNAFNAFDQVQVGREKPVQYQTVEKTKEVFSNLNHMIKDEDHEKHESDDSGVQDIHIHNLQRYDDNLDKFDSQPATTVTIIDPQVFDKRFQYGEDFFAPNVVAQSFASPKHDKDLLEKVDNQSTKSHESLAKDYSDDFCENSTSSSVSVVVTKQEPGTIKKLDTDFSPRSVEEEEHLKNQSFDKGFETDDERGPWNKVTSEIFGAEEKMDLAVDDVVLPSSSIGFETDESEVESFYTKIESSEPMVQKHDIRMVEPDQVEGALEFKIMFRPLSNVLTSLGADDAENCTNGVVWIFRTFGQCVETNVEYGAFVLGFISFLLWLLPVLPQIYQNYKRGHCDDALSLYFLIFWFLGDSLNLSGAILAQQLPIQVYTGVYFIIQDCLILGQYYYLQVYNGWRVTLFRELGRPTVSCFMFLGLVTIFSTENSALLLNSNSQSYGVKPFFHGTKDAVGYILGSLSAACYLAGRLPQLYKNMKRKSTEGVSLLMFMIIITANFLYGLSVLLSGDTFAYVLHHLPWLVGSFACCLLDCLVLYQYFLYRKPRDESLLQSTANSNDNDSILGQNAASKSEGEDNLGSMANED